MALIDDLTAWAEVVGVTVPATPEAALQAVFSGGIDPGTGALLYIVLKDAEATP